MRKKEKISDKQIIPITFDYVFTNLFGTEESIRILERFLASYLKVSMQTIKGKVKILPRELPLENKRTASKQVDILLELEGRKINLELNNNCNEGIIERNLVYASNIHGRNMEYGKKSYNEIRSTLQINLNNRRMNEELVDECYIRTKTGKIRGRKLRIDYLDLEKGREMCYSGDKEELAKWCVILTTTSKEAFERVLGEIDMEEEVKEELSEKVEKYSRDEDVVALYSAYTREELERNTMLEDAIEVGLKRGRETGIEEGIKQSKMEITKNLLKQNISIEVIKKVTGLTEKEIKKISLDL